MKKQSAKVLDYWQKISKDKTHTLHVVLIVDARYNWFASLVEVTSYIETELSLR